MYVKMMVIYTMLQKQKAIFNLKSLFYMCYVFCRIRVK